MVSRTTSLSADIVGLSIFLRRHGFFCGVEEEALALSALTVTDFRSETSYRRVLKSVFCRTKTQTESFENLYAEYRQYLKAGVDSKPGKKQADSKNKNQDASFKSLKEWLHGEAGNDEEKVAAWSPAGNLGQKDFTEISDQELEELFRIIRLVAQRLALRKRKRYKPVTRSGKPDLRRTLRKNMRTGGELLDIVFREPKPNRTKIVMLCDVSRSMELYTGFLVQFMYCFQQVYKKMETFVFSTRLTRITTTLQKKSYGQVLQELGTNETGWDGGTRIGEAMAAFVKDYAGSLLGPRTTVIILSDGWDSGDTSLISLNMEYIKRKAGRIIWLNPLAGYRHYEPLAAGMKAAIPFVDVFASAHNAESLGKLGRWL
jgi:uncharacterized protein with von Willebrand factor type A (vWA) domain